MLKRLYSTKTNVIANLVSNIWAALLSVIFVPVYLHYIGIEAYGLIGIFNSLQAFIILLDFGLSPTLNRELARLSALEDKSQEMHDVKRTLEIPNWISAAGIALLLFCLAPLIANFWIQHKDLPTRTVTQALLIMGVNTAIQFSMNFYIGGLMGLQKQVLVGCINLLCATLRAVSAVVVLALISPTIEAYLLCQTAGVLLQLVLVFLSLRVSLPETGRKARFQKDLLRKIWRYAVGMTGITIVSLILTQTDKIILSRMLSLKLFGYYALAVTISTMTISTIASSVMHAVFPKFARFVSVGDEAALRNFYHRSCQIVSVFLFPLMITLAFFSYDILLAWTHKEEIASNSYMLLSLVTIGTGLNSLMLLPYSLQLAHGWTKLAFYTNVAAIIVLVPLMILGAYRYGAIGGAVSWIILNGLYILITIQIMHRRILKGEKWRWYLQDVLVPFLVAFSVVAAGKLILPTNLPQIRSILVISVVSILTFLAAVLSTEATRNIALGIKEKFLFHASHEINAD